MKKTIFTLIIALFTITSIAQDKNKKLNLRDPDFKQIIEETSANRKCVFVIISNNNNSFCRNFLNVILSDTTTIKYLNENFVTTMVDGRIGDGLNFVKMFKIYSYPTMMIFSPEFELIGKIVGTEIDPRYFLYEIDMVLENEELKAAQRYNAEQIERLEQMKSEYKARQKELKRQK